MQQITQWPTHQTLTLPEKVKTALINHLKEPFENEEEAVEFWQENKPMLIIIDQYDTKESLKQLDNLLQNKIEIALTEPEYREILTQGYTINLAVFGNAGEGVYCLVGPKYKG